MTDLVHGEVKDQLRPQPEGQKILPPSIREPNTMGLLEIHHQVSRGGREGSRGEEGMRNKREKLRKNTHMEMKNMETYERECQ